MAHYMLSDLFDDLSDTPGTLPARRALADQARTYLHDLVAAPRAPVEVRAEAAIGYMQLAGVEGLFSAGSLGERGAAADSLARAEAVLAGATAADRGNPRWVHALGRLRLFQGFRQADAGDAAAALPVLRDAVAVLADAAAALPNDREAALDLWQARLALSDALASTGRLARRPGRRAGRPGPARRGRPSAGCAGQGGAAARAQP